MNKLVSIVIPVYNSEKYLEESLTSCFNQTYGNTEIIAVNDGSNDHSLEILLSFSDKIQVISQENKGISSAINLGIKKMKGDLFKIMNSDDILYPECVELLTLEYAKINNKKVIVHGNCDLIDSEGETIREWNQRNLNKLSQFEQNVVLLDHNTVINITSLFHKESFSKHGLFDESLRAGVDYEFWLRLCLQHGFLLQLLEKKLVKYRRHEESITWRSLKETPNYSEAIQKLVLGRLNESERQKYEIALQLYQTKNEKSLKEKVNDIVIGSVPPSSAKKISHAYRWILNKK